MRSLMGEEDYWFVEVELLYDKGRIVRLFCILPHFILNRSAMKKITVFYQPMCPFCKNAFKYINELVAENDSFKTIEWEKIDELKEPELADRFDYYYVPTFYSEGKKIHEGGIYKEELRELIQSVIDGTDFKIEE